MEAEIVLATACPGCGASLDVAGARASCSSCGRGYLARVILPEDGMPAYRVAPRVELEPWLPPAPRAPGYRIVERVDGHVEISWGGLGGLAAAWSLATMVLVTALVVCGLLAANTVALLAVLPFVLGRARFDAEARRDHLAVDGRVITWRIYRGPEPIAETVVRLDDVTRVVATDAGARFEPSGAGQIVTVPMDPSVAAWLAARAAHRLPLHAG